MPNAFVADPPLNPVIARTYELGTRGKLPVGDALQWGVKFFRTDVQDDIPLLSSGSSLPELPSAAGLA